MQQIEESEFINSQYVEGEFVSPRVILQCPLKQTDQVFNSILKKLKSGHVFLRSVKTEMGCGFVSILFQEPLFKIDSLKPILNQFRFEYQKHCLITERPSFVPPLVFSQLCFPSGMWLSLCELAKTIDYKNQQYSNTEDTTSKSQVSQQP